jgi:ribosome biogenesis GTPase
MVKLPEGGVIVDEPGLRSLPLVGHERGLAKVFPDIAEQAMACRFRDCTHTHEPGCAVLEHADTVGYAGLRLEAYLALACEMRASRATLDPDVVI